MELDLGHPFPVDEIKEIIHEVLRAVFQPTMEYRNENRWLGFSSSGRYFEAPVDLIITFEAKKPLVDAF
ncbi:MAG: hypothetical protein EZS28_055785, partial [Streblomastix strix]